MTVAVCCKPPWRQTFTAHTSGQPLMSLVLSNRSLRLARCWPIESQVGVLALHTKHHTAFPFPPDAQVPLPRHALIALWHAQGDPASSTAMGPLSSLRSHARVTRL